MKKKKNSTSKTTNKVNNKAKIKIKSKEKGEQKTSNNSLIRKKDVKMKFKYKHPKLAIALKIIIITLILVFVVAAGVLGGLIFGLWGDDINIDLSELVLDENSIIVDSEGNVLAELSGDENRENFGAKRRTYQ